METINLTIPNMKSPHCQLRVTNTVKALGGEVTAISAGTAEISLKQGLSRDQVVKAIAQAGYHVSK